MPQLFWNGDKRGTGRYKTFVSPDPSSNRPFYVAANGNVIARARGNNYTTNNNNNNISSSNENDNDLNQDRVILPSEAIEMASRESSSARGGNSDHHSRMIHHLDDFPSDNEFMGHGTLERVCSSSYITTSGSAHDPSSNNSSNLRRFASSTPTTSSSTSVSLLARKKTHLNQALKDKSHLQELQDEIKFIRNELKLSENKAAKIKEDSMATMQLEREQSHQRIRTLESIVARLEDELMVKREEMAAMQISKSTTQESHNGVVKLLQEKETATSEQLRQAHAFVEQKHAELLSVSQELAQKDASLLEKNRELNEAHQTINLQAQQLSEQKDWIRLVEQKLATQELSTRESRTLAHTMTVSSSKPGRLASPAAPASSSGLLNTMLSTEMMDDVSRSPRRMSLLANEQPAHFSALNRSSFVPGMATTALFQNDDDFDDCNDDHTHESSHNATSSPPVRVAQTTGSPERDDGLNDERSRKRGLFSEMDSPSRSTKTQISSHTSQTPTRLSAVRAVTNEKNASSLTQSVLPIQSHASRPQATAALPVVSSTATMRRAATTKRRRLNRYSKNPSTPSTLLAFLEETYPETVSKSQKKMKKKKKKTS